MFISICTKGSKQGYGIQIESDNLLEGKHFPLLDVRQHSWPLETPTDNTKRNEHKMVVILQRQIQIIRPTRLHS